MRVAIDISALESGHAGRGIGTYTDLLVKSLKQYENKHSYIFYTRKQKVPNDIDLIHIPYFDPFFLTMPFSHSVPVVVTVHDLIPIVYSNHFPVGIKGKIKWEIQKFLLKQVNHIITDSNASKTDIASVLQMNEKKITSIYLAASEEYYPDQNQNEFNKLISQFNIPRNYFLYVGDVNWNKNILGLLQAFALMKSKLNNNISDCKLLLVGKAFLNENLKEVSEINNLIASIECKKDIVKLGYIKNSNLRILYSNAIATIQPSFAEGFGFVPLEAMASGCPVIVSDRSSLKEIAGPSHLCNPDDIGSIAESFLGIIQLNPKSRKDLIDKSISWSKNFSWKHTSKATIAVYEKVIAG